jgi:hypothetical protein
MYVVTEFRPVTRYVFEFVPISIGGTISVVLENTSKEYELRFGFVARVSDVKLSPIFCDVDAY